MQRRDGHTGRGGQDDEERQLGLGQLSVELRQGAGGQGGGEPIRGEWYGRWTRVGVEWHVGLGVARTVARPSPVGIEEGGEGERPGVCYGGKRARSPAYPPRRKETF